jgi:hypothetical protein
MWHQYAAVLICVVNLVSPLEGGLTPADIQVNKKIVARTNLLCLTLTLTVY